MIYGDADFKSSYLYENLPFRNFRVHGVSQNSHLKQAKLGILEYSRANKSSDYCLNCEKKHNPIAKKKKNDKIHVLSIPFTNDHIFL